MVIPSRRVLMSIALNRAAPVIPPVWARPGGARAIDPAFQAGAAVAAVDAALRAAAPYLGAWAQRLGVAAAAAALAQTGRPEEETALRDALVFLQSAGRDGLSIGRADFRLADLAAAELAAAGPAGSAAVAWRCLAVGPVDDAAAMALLRALGGRTVAADVAAALREAETACSPFAAAAAALRAAGEGGRRIAGLWAADVALNRWLGWSCGVPLISLGLSAERKAAGDAAGVAAGLVRGAALALDRLADLGRRAAALDAARRRLRAPAAERVVARLLANDCLRPAATADLLSERAGRRLFDRLTALGAARELTGRPTFRLYGL